jgi:tetratricopeptide (TPR) repeat protein
MLSNEHFEQAESQFLYADDLIKEKRTDEARGILERINVDFPEYGKAYNHLGWIFETRHTDLRRAEDCYKSCIRYAPEYRPAYYNYAVILSMSKRFTELEKHLQAAQKVAAIDMATIHNEYGIMYEAEGLYEQAIGHYKQRIGQLFTDESIDATIKSIERCRKKQDIMNF